MSLVDAMNVVLLGVTALVRGVIVARQAKEAVFILRWRTNG